MKTSIALSVDNLTATVPSGGGPLNLLSNLSFVVQKGECVGIAGRNGSGKSTLLRALHGLTPVTSGSVHFGGSAGGKKTIMLAQRPIDNLGPSMSIFENWVVGLSIRLPLFGGREPFRSQCSEMVCKLGMGLESRLDDQVRSLSGGQQQLLAALFATESRSEVILLDEPTAALDEGASKLLIELIGRRSGERGSKSVLFVSHQLNELAKITSRVLVLKGGTLLAEVPQEPKSNYAERIKETVFPSLYE